MLGRTWARAIADRERPASWAAAMKSADQIGSAAPGATRAKTGTLKSAMASAASIARPENRAEQDREEETGKGEQHVGGAHQCVVKPSRSRRGDQSERNA
jgi:hypothetical protein